MLRKIITLSIVTVVVLIGVENLIAQEGAGEPQTEPRQRQVPVSAWLRKASHDGQEGRQRQRGRIEQPRRQQVDSEAQAKRAEAMRMKRRQEALQKKRQQSRKGRLPAEAAKKGAPKGRISREPQQTRRGQNRPMQPMFGGWLDELTKAYRDNDRKKMGQLLRKMQQARATAGQRGPGFRGRDIMGRGGRGFPPRGMGGWGRGYPGGGIMNRGGRGFQDGGMGGWGRGFQGRDIMSRGGQGFPPRGMGRRERDLPEPKEDEDVIRPMQRRSMSGWGRGFQGGSMMSRGGRGFQDRRMGRRPGPRFPEPKPE